MYAIKDKEGNRLITDKDVRFLIEWTIVEQNRRANFDYKKRFVEKLKTYGIECQIEKAPRRYKNTKTGKVNLFWTQVLEDINELFDVFSVNGIYDIEKID